MEHDRLGIPEVAPKKRKYYKWIDPDVLNKKYAPCRMSDIYSFGYLIQRYTTHTTTNNTRDNGKQHMHVLCTIKDRCMTKRSNRPSLNMIVSDLMDPCPQENTAFIWPYIFFRDQLTRSFLGCGKTITTVCIIIHLLILFNLGGYMIVHQHAMTAIHFSNR